MSVPETGLCAALLMGPGWKKADGAPSGGQGLRWKPFIPNNKFSAHKEVENQPSTVTKKLTLRGLMEKGKWKVSPQERVDTEASPTSKETFKSHVCTHVCVCGCVFVCKAKRVYVCARV